MTIRYTNSLSLSLSLTGKSDRNLFKEVMSFAENMSQFCQVEKVSLQRFRVAVYVLHFTLQSLHDHLRPHVAPQISHLGQKNLFIPYCFGGRFGAAVTVMSHRQRLATSNLVSTGIGDRRLETFFSYTLPRS